MEEMTTMRIRIAVAACGLLMVTACGVSEDDLVAAQDRADKAEAAQAAAADELATAKGQIDNAQRRVEQAEGELALAATQIKTAEAAAAAKAAAGVKARVDALAAKEAAVLAREKAVGTAEAEAAANTFEGDGLYIVGDDIKPGTYKSDGGEGCYWERQSKGGEIIDNDLSNGSTVVTVRASDFSLKVSRCAPFTLAQ